MNRISPKALLHSKWTKIKVTNKEKHFVVSMVEFHEDQRVTKCVIEAVMSRNEYDIDWHDLKDKDLWAFGWV